MSSMCFLCLLLLLVVTNSQTQKRPDNEQPSLKLTYEVRYNTTLPKVSEDCGRFYAGEFLDNFIQQESQIQSICGNNQGGITTSTVHVSVLAKVTILAGQCQCKIVLDTYLNISSRISSWDQAKRNILDCAGELNATFSNLAENSWLRDPLVRIAQKGNCSEAQLHPEKLDFSNQDWVCIANFTYNPDEDRCIPTGGDGGTPSTVNPSTTESESQEDVDEEEDEMCTLECINQLASRVNDTHFCLMRASIIPDCIGLVHPDPNDSGFIACVNYVNILVSQHDGGCPYIITTPPDTTTITEETSTGLPTTTSAMSTEPAGSTVPVYTTAPFTSQPAPDDWGIQVYEGKPKDLELTEGGSEDYLIFKAWANHSLCEGVTDCTLSIRIYTEENRTIQNLKPRCRSTDTPIEQVVVGQHSFGLSTKSSDQNYCSVDLQSGSLGVNVTIPVKAKVDGKYDGTQVRNFGFLLYRSVGDSEVLMHTLSYQKEVIVYDADRKATCQSINDPHITTFDGTEYNNYYQGEFILYKHKELPFSVNAVYQKCEQTVEASCNCAVAVQSYDDVIVIDRCLRKRNPPKRISGQERQITTMAVTLYLNGVLTPGTKIFQEADGKKYFIYLPTGTYIKVMVSGELVNVWVMGSPYDFTKTEGLCGTYTADVNDELLYRDGHYGDASKELLARQGERPQPRDFIQAWRVQILGEDSLLQGVPPSTKPYTLQEFCECHREGPVCSKGGDVETCDTYQGTDVTQTLVENAIRPIRARTRRSTDDYSVNAIDAEPIDVNPNSSPPEYHWNSVEAEETAKEFCKVFLEDGALGKLCSQVPGVNIKQEVTTCVEDIQITGNVSWASSARDALKEQCWEQIRRNGSLPSDMADLLSNMTCVNDCNEHGKCTKGTCYCDSGFTTSDCSVSTSEPPYVSRMPAYGLCDVNNRNCSRVMVYGQDFINSPNLTCHLQEAKVGGGQFKITSKIVTKPAIFINFNKVECPIPKSRASYLIAVSNDGIHQSDQLLFIPVDSRCQHCNISSLDCYIHDQTYCWMDNQCYSQGERSDSDPCKLCRNAGNKGEWFTTEDGTCQGDQQFKVWQIAVIAAIAGSIIGLLVGLLLYWGCCMRRGTDNLDYHDPGHPESTHFDESVLHRDRNLAVFQNPDICPLPHTPSSPRTRGETFFHNNGQGVENGVDDTTYF